MDILHEYASALLTFYFTTLQPMLSPLIALLTTLYTSLLPTLTPILDAFVRLLHDSPSWAAVGILLLTLLVSLQVLNVMRRMLVWWTRLVFRVLFWGAVVVLVLVVRERGVEKTVGDLVEWGTEVRRVWWREYRRWEGLSAGAGAGAGRAGKSYGGYGGYGQR